MKLAISILRGQAAGVRNVVKTQTQNANWHSDKAKEARAKAAAYIRQAETEERSAGKSAEARNSAQVELNELELAITKLEQ